MRLNSGDCTPEAQSAQRREWLPACCSCLSGCEEGAVSLVRIGEEQVGTPTPARTSASAEAWASAGTNCTAEAVQCPPTLRFAHSPVPDDRPASCLPTPAQTCVGPPGHQPTCQPANPTRECGVDWQGVGAQLYGCIPSPTRHATQGQKWQARRDVLCWAAQEERTRETSEVGRHGVHQPTARGTVPTEYLGTSLVEPWSSFWSSFAGPTRLGRRALLPASVNQDRSAKTVHISQYQFHSTQRSPSAHHKPQPTACSCLQGELGSPPSQLYYMPICALHLLQAARRGHSFCAPSVRSRECCRDLLSPPSQPGPSGTYLGTHPATYLGIHGGPVRPFLARFLCGLMRATNKQSTRPAGLPPGSPPPGLSFFRSRLKNHARMGRRKGEAHV